MGMRSPVAAERLGAHGRQGRQGDAEHRDDGVYLCVEHAKVEQVKGQRSKVKGQR